MRRTYSFIKEEARLEIMIESESQSQLTKGTKQYVHIQILGSLHDLASEKQQNDHSSSDEEDTEMIETIECPVCSRVFKHEKKMREVMQANSEELFPV